MESFFTKGRREAIDLYTATILFNAFEKRAFKDLAYHHFHFQKAIPSSLMDEAFEWLDDTAFDGRRITFYSKKIQILYDDFLKLAHSLHGEIVNTYSGGGEDGLKVNSPNMTGAQKRELQEKLSRLAEKTNHTLENLWTVTDSELKLSGRAPGI